MPDLPAVRQATEQFHIRDRHRSPESFEHGGRLLTLLTLAMWSGQVATR